MDAARQGPAQFLEGLTRASGERIGAHRVAGDVDAAREVAVDDLDGEPLAPPVGRELPDGARQGAKVLADGLDEPLGGPAVDAHALLTGLPGDEIGELPGLEGLGGDPGDPGLAEPGEQPAALGAAGVLGDDADRLARGGGELDEPGPQPVVGAAQVVDDDDAVTGEQGAAGGLEEVGRARRGGVELVDLDVRPLGAGPREDRGRGALGQQRLGAVDERRRTEDGI